MKQIARYACLILLVAATEVVAADYPLRKAVECRPRGGLPNVLAKLQKGGVVKIAYLGGSITAQPGWRVKSRAWFQDQYPKADVQEINAAIGGTGSDLGVFRLGQDVLRHKPDLLFVEFAVNDGGASPKRIGQAMEGIVRQTWRTDPKIDICFVYTLAERDLKDLQAGYFQRSASVMETVADHYGIPSIHMGLRVAQMEKAGQLIFRAEGNRSKDGGPMVFSHDGVHPLVETGHELYLQSIVRSMAAIEKEGTPRPHALPEPLDRNNWERAKLVPLSSEMLSGGWEKLPQTDSMARRFERNMPELYVTGEPGSSIHVKFKGTQVGVFDLMGPDGGAIRVELDDNPPQTRRRMDGYCTYHRMSKLTVAEGLPDTEHSVALTLLADALDRRSILFERNRHDFDEHPEKYEGTRWYVGSLMLIGELE